MPSPTAASPRFGRDAPIPQQAIVPPGARPAGPAPDSVPWLPPLRYLRLTTEPGHPPHPPRIPAEGPPRDASPWLQGRRWRFASIGIVLATFLLYSSTFIDRPIILDRIDAILDADTPQFAALFQRYSPGYVYGVADQMVRGTLDDLTQGHKIRHTLVAMVGRVAFLVLHPLELTLPLPASWTTFAVNALFGAINMGLFLAIARTFMVSGTVLFAMAGLYALAISSWIGASIPEWGTISAMMNLTALWVVRRGFHPVWLGVVVGAALLNSLIHLLLLGVLGLHDLRKGVALPRVILRNAQAAAVAVGIFTASLTLLSLGGDEFYQVPRFLKLWRWYSVERMPYILSLREAPPASSRYAIRHSLAATFGASVVSNQEDRNFPAEGFEWTLLHGGLGSWAAATWLLLLVTAAVLVFRQRPWQRPWWNSTPLLPELVLIAGLHWLSVHTSFWTAAMLHSVQVVPVFLLALAAVLDTRRVLGARLLVAAVGLFIVNNVQQVSRLRGQLRDLAPPSKVITR